MNWYAIYATANGALVNIGTGQPTSLPAGLAFMLIGQAPPDSSKVWDAATHSFVTSNLHAVLTLREFWNRWTSDEREALYNIQQNGTATQKNKLGAFKDYVLACGVVDCNDSYIRTAVTLAETAGILAAGRAVQILA